MDGCAMFAMRIHELILPVSDLPAAVRYFRDVLQLEVDNDRVRIGWSSVQLQSAGDLPVGGVHLAFNVPHNRFSDRQGDFHGSVLIVVDASRRWFPEQRALPNARGLRLRLADVGAAATLEDATHGWCAQSD